MAAQRSDPAVLLRTEHAVARVLATAPGEAEAYPALLAAMGRSLAWDFGAVWVPEGDVLRCIDTWPEAGDFAAESLATRAGAGRGPARPRVGGRGARPGSPTCRPRARSRARAPPRAPGLQSAFAFPVRGAALLARDRVLHAPTCATPTRTCSATMTSLGSQIGQFVERCRAEQAVRDADARKSAILNAAFDCVVTMDHNGDIVEVNKATERTFGYTRRARWWARSWRS